MYICDGNKKFMILFIKLCVFYFVYLEGGTNILNEVIEDFLLYINW